MYVKRTDAYKEKPGALTGKKQLVYLTLVWRGDFSEGWKNPGILEISLSLSKLRDP